MAPSGAFYHAVSSLPASAVPITDDYFALTKLPNAVSSELHHFCERVAPPQASGGRSTYQNTEGCGAFSAASVVPRIEEILVRRLIELGGGVFVGLIYVDHKSLGGAVVLFNKPGSHSPLSVPVSVLTSDGAELVRKMLQESDDRFRVSIAPTEGDDRSSPPSRRNEHVRNERLHLQYACSLDHEITRLTCILRDPRATQHDHYVARQQLANLIDLVDGIR
jgi:hypothetical protein